MTRLPNFQLLGLEHPCLALAKCLLEEEGPEGMAVRKSSQDKNAQFKKARLPERGTSLHYLRRDARVNSPPVIVVVVIVLTKKVTFILQRRGKR